MILPLISFALVAASAADTSARPNVLLVMADDQGWGDTGYNGHPELKTPHLDKLAGDGTRFMQFYATGVTRCPSRTGFMTSKFPATFAKYPANGGFGHRVTTTELLKKTNKDDA
jgi:arylsulfatase A-like enzyme